jgi:hypothetical protein
VVTCSSPGLARIVVRDSPIRSRIYSRQQRVLVVGGLPDCSENPAVGGAEQAGRQHVTASHGSDLARDHGFHTLPLGNLPRQGGRQRDGGGALHSSQGVGDRLGVDQPERGRLRQVHAKGLGERLPQRGIRRAVLEIGQDQGLALFEHA